MTVLRRFAAAVAVLGLALAGSQAVAQDAARELERLEAAATPGLIDALRRDDPDALIDLQLALAAAYADAGLTDDAIAAYEQALMSMLQFRGQGHPSMADPMTAVGRLADDPSVRLRWLETAQALRIADWGADDPRLVPFAEEIEQARAAIR